MSSSEPLVCFAAQLWSGMSGRSSTVSNSALLACSRASIQRGEAGAAEEDAVEAPAQRERLALAGFEPASLEAGVEVPDQVANLILRGTMAVVERIQLMRQPFRMNPAQRVPADIELTRVVAQHDGVTQEFVRLNAAPQRALGRDRNWIGRNVQRREAEPIEMRQPRCPISEARLWFSRQTADQFPGQ